MEPSGRRLISLQVVWQQRAGVWALSVERHQGGGFRIVAVYLGRGWKECMWWPSREAAPLRVLTWAVGEGREVPGLGEGSGTL